MPSTRHTFGKCGHKGLGDHCHRCEEADRMDTLSGAKAKALPNQVGKLPCRGRAPPRPERQA